jgi:hypothetical protein
MMLYPYIKLNNKDSFWLKVFELFPQGSANFIHFSVSYGIYAPSKWKLKKIQEIRAPITARVEISENDYRCMSKEKLVYNGWEVVSRKMAPLGKMR